MIRFKHHFPNFVDAVGEPNPIIEFNNMDDLINKSTTLQRWKTCPDFSYFAKCSDKVQPAIMAIFKEEWFVVGFIDRPDDLDLPEWKHSNE